MRPSRLWTLLPDYLRPQRARAFGLGFLLVGGIALQLASPQSPRRFIDTAMAGATPRPSSPAMPARSAGMGASQIIVLKDTAGSSTGATSTSSSVAATRCGGYGRARRARTLGLRTRTRAARRRGCSPTPRPRASPGRPRRIPSPGSPANDAVGMVTATLEPALLPPALRAVVFVFGGFLGDERLATVGAEDQLRLFPRPAAGETPEERLKVGRGREPVRTR